MTVRHVPYLIVGGGMTAHAAVEGIRTVDDRGGILVVGSEPAPPYARPPLSKALWRDGGDGASTDLGTRALDADVVVGRRIVAVDAGDHVATRDDGVRYRYDRLLLATGARPRTLPHVPIGGPVLAFRTLADFREARRRVGAGTRTVVVGGGFVGTEMAAALTGAGAQVELVFPERVLAGARFPDGLARTIQQDYLDRGVHLHPGLRVTRAAVDGERVRVGLDDGTRLDADLVIVGIGTAPNVVLAVALGLATEGGIHVDRTFRTEARDVFAAGDVAAFPHPVLGDRTRVEHEDAALTTGRHAGRAMAGIDEPYDHVPFFYSDLFDNGYEAVGEIDTRHTTSELWSRRNAEGAVYYHERGVVRGVLLFNAWGRLDEARQALGARVPDGARAAQPEAAR